MNKYDLNSLELSSKYHDTNKLLDSQIQYKLKETDKNFNTVNNHTAEATVFYVTI